MSKFSEDSTPKEIYPEDSVRKISTKRFLVIQLRKYKSGTFPYDIGTSFTHIVFGNIERIPNPRTIKIEDYIPNFADLPLGVRVKKKQEHKERMRMRTNNIRGGYHVPIDESFSWFSLGCIARGLRQGEQVYLLRADAVTSRIAATYYSDRCAVCKLKIAQDMTHCLGCGATIYRTNR